MPHLIDEFRQQQIQTDVLFVLADDAVLLKRYSETRRRHPLAEHGAELRAAIEAEREILAAHPAATVCRLPLMFGNAGPGAQSFVQPWLATLARGEPLKLFTDEYRTVVAGHVAATGEIGPLVVTRVENKGRHNKRVYVAFA